MTILSRADQIGGTAFDSIAWALDVHIKKPDTRIYNYGILHGNEDAPLRIQLWREDPEWTTPCDLDWTPEQTTEQRQLGDNETQQQKTE